MTSSYPNPWNFSNNDKNLVSPVGHFRIEYGDLYEVAMGAPVGSECYLVYPDNSKLKLSDWAGGPAIWETRGKKVAFPVWTRAREQKIAVADIDASTLSIYSQIFRVLNLKTFDKEIIKGQDSPIYMTEAIEFDILKEKVEKVKPLN